MPFDKPKEVDVLWQDSSRMDGWVDKNKVVSNTDLRVFTRGYLVNETSDRIQVAHSVCEHQWLGIVDIPRICIIRMKVRK